MIITDYLIVDNQNPEQVIRQNMEIAEKSTSVNHMLLCIAGWLKLHPEILPIDIERDFRQRGMKAHLFRNNCYLDCLFTTTNMTWTNDDELSYKLYPLISDDPLSEMMIRGQISLELNQVDDEELYQMELTRIKHKYHQEPDHVFLLNSIYNGAIYTLQIDDKIVSGFLVHLFNALDKDEQVREVIEMLPLVD